MNTPLSDKVPGQSDPEIDPYGSYTINLGGALDVQPGFTVYTYPRAPLDQGFYHATFEPNLAVNYTRARREADAETLLRFRAAGAHL